MFETHLLLLMKLKEGVAGQGLKKFGWIAVQCDVEISQDNRLFKAGSLVHSAIIEIRKVTS